VPIAGGITAATGDVVGGCFGGRDRYPARISITLALTGIRRSIRRAQASSTTRTAPPYFYFAERACAFLRGISGSADAQSVLDQRKNWFQPCGRTSGALLVMIRQIWNPAEAGYVYRPSRIFLLNASGVHEQTAPLADGGRIAGFRRTGGLEPSTIAS
jgi:hypothetical protein